MSIASGTRFGPYEVLALIGAGGMGEVYRARDTRLERLVAIKIIAPHLARDPEALARFQREARAIAALSHPNILAIHDVGSEGDAWFVVTELLDGEGLRTRLARGALSWPEVVTTGIAVAEGLSSAHAREIVHRDIKPENVFLTTDDRVKILDFGLAYQAPMVSAPDAETRTPLALHSTDPGVIAGTVGYMSPEQIQGRRLDGRSDLFSLGCVLYEMLAGQPPFRGESAADTLAAILRDPVKPLTDPAVPASLAKAVLRCLEKDRDRRFQSAKDLTSALKAIQAGATPSGLRRPQEPSSPTVAVLPFRNLTADPDSDAFADGVTEDVIAHLAKVRSLNVISRRSVAAFKEHNQTLREIGRTLGASTIVEGSVRRFGNRVRIVAQLVDTEGDRHLWADTYDRDLTDIFAIQTDVALQIAGALRAELSSDERSRMHTPPTRDLEAYQLYLQGRQYTGRHTDEGYRQSLAYFERAIAKDPNFALAYVGLARAYAEGTIQGIGPKSDVSFRRAKEAVGKALAIDDRLGDAHGIVGLLKFIMDFDWEGAEEEFKLALELSPGSADIHDHYGWFCSSLGRFDDAIRLVQRASELDPLEHRTDVASELLRAGRFEESLARALKVVEVEPGYARGHSIAGWAYIMTGRHSEGVAALERAVAVSPGSTLFLAQLGQAYAMAGEPAKARRILEQLQELSRKQYVAPYHFAYVHTGLGEAEAALDRLEQSYLERSGAIYGIKGSFLFVSLRTHPRFIALLKRMNLA